MDSSNELIIGFKHGILTQIGSAAFKLVTLVDLRRERTECFTSIAFLLACGCLYSVAPSCGAVNGL